MAVKRRRTGRKPESAAGGERLQKILAGAGIASRRACEQLIRQGRVSINGKIVRELGTRAHPGRDRISVDGRRVRVEPRLVHYVLYKPRGVVSTTRDAHAKRTVLDLVPRRERLFPVGRLDAASEGLLLLTNDGALAQLLLHPSYRVPRTYKVSVDGAVKADSLRRIGRGIELDGKPTAPCEVELIEQTPERSVLEMTLIEGRQRQIRQMMKVIGHPVRRLLRVRFGPLRLRGLHPGEWRALDARETAALERMREQLTGSGRGESRRQDRR
jgi:23S rRNA pseudouridine2605 synthase